MRYHPRKGTSSPKGDIIPERGYHPQFFGEAFFRSNLQHPCHCEGRWSSSEAYRDQARSNLLFICNSPADTLLPVVSVPPRTRT